MSLQGGFLGFGASAWEQHGKWALNIRKQSYWWELSLAKNCLDIFFKKNFHEIGRDSELRSIFNL